jgi:hypothetical protein
MFVEAWIHLERLIKDAPNNPAVEEALRQIVEKSARKAPLPDLCLIAQLLIDIRKRDMKVQDETN